MVVFFGSPREIDQTPLQLLSGSDRSACAGRALLHITSFRRLCRNARFARFEPRRPRTLHSSHTSTRLVRELIATRSRTRARTSAHAQIQTEAFSRASARAGARVLHLRICVRVTVFLLITTRSSST